MKQQMRFSEAELATIKGSFADNELAITAIRKVFLEDELSENEQTALKLAVKTKAAKEVLRRHFCPELKVDAPIGQVQDRLMLVRPEELDPATTTLQAAAMERTIACIDAHVEEIFGASPGLSFKKLYTLDMSDPEETYIGLLARNNYVMQVERLTHHLSLLAGRKEETPSETVERLKKDSAK